MEQNQIKNTVNQILWLIVADCFVIIVFFYFLPFDRLRKTFLKNVKFAGGCISLRKNSYMYILHVLLWT